MTVIIQKPDLDTCLTAWILGVTHQDTIVVSVGDADKTQLADPSVICIEAGGSGQTHLNNFDHHNTDQYLPPACRQAYDSKGIRDPDIRRLVEYVCIVDESPQQHPPVEFPSLSNIFSGMLFSEIQPAAQFFKGIDILKMVYVRRIDPFGSMPDLDEWRLYRRVKQERMEMVKHLLKQALFYTSRRGFRIGFVESPIIGGIGYLLHSQGCDAAVMFDPAYGNPPKPKFTIATKCLPLTQIQDTLNQKEPGWGGRETIIGSPRTGTTLDPNTVLHTVVEKL